MHKKIAVIALDFSDQLDASIQRIADWPMLKDFRLHFVHVQPCDYSSHFQDEIRRETLEHLKTICHTSFQSVPSENIECHCIFSDNVPEAVSDYATRVDAELVLLPSREKLEESIVDNEVAHYLISHCPATLMVMR